MTNLAKVQNVAGATEDKLAVARILERVSQLRPMMIAAQAATETDTQYGEDLHQAFAEAGLYRILVPKEYGGLGLPPRAFVKIVMAIARGCASTAWMYTFGHSHTANIAMMFDASLQAEIFHGDCICPMTLRPQGNAIQKANGDWLLSGDFNYCSGIPHASHFLSNTFPTYSDGSTGKPIAFLARRGDWTVLNDWGDMIGLKGSGSHSIRFDNAVIPARFVLDSANDEDEPAKKNFGRRLHGGNAMGYGRTYSWLILHPASIAVGVIKGALDDYAALLRTKTTLTPPIQLRKDHPDFKRWFGRAIGKISSAEASLLQAAWQWEALARREMDGEEIFSSVDNARLALIGAEAMNTAWDVMQETLWRTVGSTPTKDGERMQRIFRDLAMIRSHAGNMYFDTVAREMSDQILNDHMVDWADSSDYP